MSKNVYEGLKRILFTLETSMYAQCCYVRQFRTLSRGQSHPCMPQNFCTALKLHSILRISEFTKWQIKSFRHKSFLITTKAPISIESF
jgi:hypothetical protein